MNTITKMILIFLVMGLYGCTNYFKKYYTYNTHLEDYHQNLIKESGNPEVLYTQNPELDAIGLLENGLINLGYSAFQRQKFNDEKQAIEFGKEIGAGVILIQSRFEQKQNANEDRIRYKYAVSPIPVSESSGTMYAHGFPDINYNFSVDLETGEVTENTSAVITPDLHIQSSYKNGRPVKQQVSTTIAQQVWNIPVDRRNYVAVPNDQGAFIMPFEKQEEEVDVYSYSATFWTGTHYPPALGVNVTDLTPEQKQRVKLDFGVSVWAVFKNSPAKKAGIVRGDLLLTINGEPIKDSYFMGELIRKNVGREIRLQLVQNGKIVTRKIRLNEQSF